MEAGFHGACPSLLWSDDDKTAPSLDSSSQPSRENIHNPDGSVPEQKSHQLLGDQVEVHVGHEQHEPPECHQDDGGNLWGRVERVHEFGGEVGPSQSLDISSKLAPASPVGLDLKKEIQ